MFADAPLASHFYFSSSASSIVVVVVCRKRFINIGSMNCSWLVHTSLICPRMTLTFGACIKKLHITILLLSSHDSQFVNCSYHITDLYAQHKHAHEKLLLANSLIVVVGGGGGIFRLHLFFFAFVTAAPKLCLSAHFNSIAIQSIFFFASSFHINFNSIIFMFCVFFFISDCFSVDSPVDVDKIISVLLLGCCISQFGTAESE